MSGNWTPGPWQVNPKAATNVEANNGRQIRGVAACGGYYDNTSNGAWAAENEANAHLIAAAPDLYAALEVAYAFIADQYGDAEAQALQGEFVSKEARPVWDAICNALAKARGETK